MKRELNLTVKSSLPTQEAMKNELRQCALNMGLQTDESGYFARVEDNVFPDAVEGIAEGGRFRQMFMNGDGGELKGDKAHAKAVHSSSMLAYNFFYWVSPQSPLRYKSLFDGETTYDKIYFEVKMRTLKSSRRPANMDILLVSDDCRRVWCIESKFTEPLADTGGANRDAYADADNYYAIPFRDDLTALNRLIRERPKVWCEGIAQNLRHLTAISNLRYDADALAWFKANNPCIGNEVLEQLTDKTEWRFSNLLYGSDLPSRLDVVFTYVGEWSSFRIAHRQDEYELLLDGLYSSLPKELWELYRPYMVYYDRLLSNVYDQVAVSDAVRLFFRRVKRAANGVKNGVVLAVLVENMLFLQSSLGSFCFSL